MRFILTYLFLISLNVQGQDLVYSEGVIANYESGVLAHQNNDSKTALDFFSLCIQADSTCFEAYYGLGLIHFEAGRFNQTLLNTSKAETLRPFDPELTGLIGRTSYQTQNYANAEVYLKRAISIGVYNPDNLLYLALSLQKQLNYTYALHYFDQLLIEDPSNRAYRFNRGLLYVEMEDFENALGDFQKTLLSGQKPLPYHYFHLAKTSLSLNEGQQCLAYIEQGLPIASKDEKIDLLILKGTFYRDIGEYEIAQKHYQTAYELENENPLVLTHQAAVLIDLENYELAIEKCDAAIALNPSQMEAYFNRGIANEMIRDLDQACSDWQKAFVLGSQKAIHYLNGPVCNE
ncbi:MAG: tetratricopeptide repeat protein [Crocinitomix sp.]|nr:tetratricopeptide repeat protein [Crocinitomix sp.]